MLMLIVCGFALPGLAQAHPDFGPRHPAPARSGFAPAGRPVAAAPAQRFAPPQAPPAAQNFAVPEPRRPNITPGDAAHRAQEANGGGRVLAVDPMQEGYRVKLLKDGEVRAVQVPQPEPR